MEKLQLILSDFEPRGDQETADLKIFKEFANDRKNLTRDSIAHFTASAFVVNKSHDKVLAIFHNIYQSWGWMGGHADGDSDLIAVAQKEVSEESGITGLKLLRSTPISIESIPVLGHTYRNHGYVSTHIHLNVTFLFEADETDKVSINPDENSGVDWIELDEFVDRSSEEHMKTIYRKIIERIKEAK